MKRLVLCALILLAGCAGHRETIRVEAGSADWEASGHWSVMYEVTRGR